MFGTLGFSELIIILAIVLLIVGAGRLPQIGEGVGKALKGFKKEIHDVPAPIDEQSGQMPVSEHATNLSTTPTSPQMTPIAELTPQSAVPSPSQPGPERTPGTLASQVYGGFGPERVQPTQPADAMGTAQDDSAYQEPFQPVTMEQRASGTVPQPWAQYPPVPQKIAPTATGKRPDTIVNAKAVARVKAQRAAMQRAKESASAQSQQIAAGDSMQSLGEGLGSTLRTIHDAAADVRNAIDPEMQTIKAEMESAQKEVEQSLEAAKSPPVSRDSPPTY